MSYRLALYASCVAVLAGLCSPAQAVNYPCWLVYKYVDGYSRDQLKELAKQYHVTPQDRARVRYCLSIRPRR